MRLLRAITIVAGIALFCSGPARGDEPFVDPYQVTSSSGAWVLSVTPSDAEGAGGAAYRMVHAGKEAWAAPLEVTLRECVVSDNGLVVGYAYDNGYMGWSGHMVVLAVGPEGKVLTREQFERETLFGMTPNPPGYPRGAGVLLDAVGERAIVCVWPRVQQHPVEWWVYSLKDGAALARQVPQTPHNGENGFSKEIDARSVPGTGLIAVHWLAYEGGKQSACFQLIDQAGGLVWSKRIDGEYANMPERWNWSELIAQGVRQMEVEERGLAIVSYAEGKRSRYRLVKDDAAGWKVVEAGQEEAKPSGKSPSRPELALTKRDLRAMGEIRLQSAESGGVIDEIHTLCIDDRGRIGWARRASDAGKPATHFTLVDREGKTIADHALDLPKDESASLSVVAWLDQDRWLVARTSYPGKTGPGRASAWFLDAATGTLKPADAFEGGTLKRICRTADGGYVVLGSLHGNYTIRDQVTRYDREGRIITSKTEPGYGRGDNIMDIAVLSDGTLALMTGVADRSQLKLFRSGKEEPEIWDIAQLVVGAAGPEMSYYADIRADAEGGVIIYDSANQNLLHRIDKNGTRWQSFHVRGPKGETFRLYDAFAVDPDGRVWASDGARLLRCAESGTADLALGGPPEGAMADPAALTLDAGGTIYALERGTAAVHVFDADGKPVRVMRPEPTDSPTQEALAWIRAEPDGRVRYRMNWDGPVVVFGPDGKRIGTEPKRDRMDRTPVWEAVPGGGWECDGKAVRRLAADGSVVRTIAHRPSGDWLVHVVSSCAAPDGSLAVLAERQTPGRMGIGRGPLWMCLYAPDGSGRGEVSLARTSYFHEVLYDGRRVLIPDEKGITVLRSPLEAKAERFGLPGAEGTYWHVMLRPDGTLAAWANGQRAVLRWELPE